MNKDRFKFRVWWEKEKRYRIDVKMHPAEHFCQKDFIVEQCTGLKDKNGNLIYEGDTVRYWWNQKTNTGTICWDNYFARFCIANNKEHSTETPHCLMFVADKKIIEIIGNRHEPKGNQ